MAFDTAEKQKKRSKTNTGTMECGQKKRGSSRKKNQNWISRKEQKSRLLNCENYKPLGVSGACQKAAVYAHCSRELQKRARPATAKRRRFLAVRRRSGNRFVLGNPCSSGEKRRSFVPNGKGKSVGSRRCGRDRPKRGAGLSGLVSRKWSPCEEGRGRKPKAWRKL